MKFIHCADIHLDSPLRGLSRYQDAPVEALRGATRRAFENLIDLAIEQQVAFVLITGDLYDGTWQDFNTGLFFTAQMGRLMRHAIQVFVVRGNHDADSRMTRSLPLPANVRVFESRRAETHVDPTLHVAIHGQSFAEAATTADLAAGYPPRVPGLFNIGLLHTSVNGREGHADYAPCSLDTLLSKGYDYWALGHVHAREVLHQDPWVVFPGNLQGRHSRETGPKGCELVTVEHDRVVSVEPHTVDVLRWQQVEVDVTDMTQFTQVADALQARLRGAVRGAHGRALAVRLRLHGRAPIHSALAVRPEQVKEELRAVALSCAQGEVWLEKILLETRPTLDVHLTHDHVVGHLIQLIRDVPHDASLMAALAVSWQDLVRKLPPELTEGLDEEAWSGDARTRRVLQEVEAMLIPRLLEECAP